MNAMFAVFFSLSFQEIVLSSLLSSFWNVVMETAIKHPQAPEQRIIEAEAEIIYCEERSGGVAAIEQPPEAENCSWRGTRRKMKEKERETAGKKHKTARGVP
nr:hypothetical protein [uncultured Flavobacterium sp.]